MPDTSTAVFFAGLAIAAVIAKYVLSVPGSSAGPGSASNSQENGPRPVTEDMISVVSVLVPHIDRETIRKDLEETHSVEATSQRLLAKKPTQKSGGSSSLLDKYNVGEPSQSPAAASSSSSDTAWVDDRKQREERFKRQRQEMVLRARQRTLELEQKKAQEGSRA